MRRWANEQHKQAMLEQLAESNGKLPPRLMEVLQDKAESDR